MWGTKANTWTAKESAAGSMKWHLIDETSLEKRTIDVGWGRYTKTAERTYGVLDCGRKGKGNASYYDAKLPLVLRDEVNISQANICAHCKKARMEELNIEKVQI